MSKHIFNRTEILTDSCSSQTVTLGVCSNSDCVNKNLFNHLLWNLLQAIEVATRDALVAMATVVGRTNAISPLRNGTFASCTGPVPSLEGPRIRNELAQVTM